MKAEKSGQSKTEMPVLWDDSRVFKKLADKLCLLGCGLVSTTIPAQTIPALVLGKLVCFIMAPSSLIDLIH